MAKNYNIRVAESVSNKWHIYAGKMHEEVTEAIQDLIPEGDKLDVTPDEMYVPHAIDRNGGMMVTAIYHDSVDLETENYEYTYQFEDLTALELLQVLDIISETLANKNA